jgi:hypothetical protein
MAKPELVEDSARTARLASDYERGRRMGLYGGAALIAWFVVAAFKIATDPLARTLLFLPFVLIGAIASVYIGLTLQGSITRAVRRCLGAGVLQVLLRVLALAVAPAVIVGALAFVAFATFFDPRAQQGIPPLVLAGLLLGGMLVVFAIARWLGRVLGRMLPHGQYLIRISAAADAAAAFGALAVYALYASSVAVIFYGPFANASAEALLAVTAPIAWIVIGAEFVSGWSDATVRQRVREALIVEEVQRQERDNFAESTPPQAQDSDSDATVVDLMAALKASLDRGKAADETRSRKESDPSSE